MALLVDLERASAAIHPECGEACARGPGEAQVRAERGERRQVEEGAVSAQVERHAPVFLAPHVQLVVVRRAVRKQDDLPLALELGGHAHAEREGRQTHGLLRGQLHIAEVSLIREEEHLATQTCTTQTEHTVEITTNRKVRGPDLNEGAK